MNNSGLIPTEGKNNGCGHVCRLVLLPYVTCWHQTLPSDLFRRNRLDQTEQDLSITLIAVLDNLSASVRKDTCCSSRESVEASWNSVADQSRSANSRWISHGQHLACSLRHAVVRMCNISDNTFAASRPNELKSDLDHLWTFFPIVSDRDLFCLTECCWTGFWKSETGHKHTWQDA